MSYASETKIVADMVAEKIRSGAVPRPLTPEALLRETLSAFAPDLGLDQYPIRQHLKLARAVFALLVKDGIVRPVPTRRDMSGVRAALRARVDAMPEPTVPQHPLGWVPEDDEEAQ